MCLQNAHCLSLQRILKSEETRRIEFALINFLSLGFRFLILRLLVNVFVSQASMKIFRCKASWKQQIYYRDVVKREGSKVNNKTVGNSCLFYLLLSLSFIMNI